MRKSLQIMILAAAFVVLGASPSMANGLEEADIDPGECEIIANGQQFEDEEANAHVIAADGNLVVGNCHIVPDEQTILNLGGPFRSAQVFKDFLCLIETEGTLEDIEAFMSHAVLTPNGRLNITCMAEFAEGDPPPED